MTSGCIGRASPGLGTALTQALQTPHASAVPSGPRERSRVHALHANEGLRQSERRPLLSDAVGPLEEIRVVHPPGAEGATERLDRRGLPAHGRQKRRQPERVR